MSKVAVKNNEGDRETWEVESDRQTDIDRQTNRQTDRQTDRHTDRQTDRETDRQTKCEQLKIHIVDTRLDSRL